MIKGFKNQKDLKLFIKKFFKKHLKGLSPETKIEIKIIKLNPPEVVLKFPFYSEGNLIRVNEVDFLLKELMKYKINAQIQYIDDLENFGEN